MDLSTARVFCLEATVSAWKETGTPFLAFINGVISPLENVAADDFGLSYFVPKLALTFDISWQTALLYWDACFVVIGVIVASAAFCCLSKTVFEKIIASVGVGGIGLICWSIGDVYIAPFVAVCFLPWIFVLFNNQSSFSFYVYGIVVGFVSALINSFRMYAGFTLWIGVFTAVILSKQSFKKTILFLTCFFFGFAVYASWFSYLIHQRNRYLDEHHIVHGSHEPKHVFWHSVYLGLGFLQNSYGIYYGDSCGLEYARKNDPQVEYCSKTYNEILKKRTFDLCKEHPFFVLRTIFAKIGVLFYYFLLFANIGLLCAFLYRKPWYIELSYGTTLFFSALPALATIPIGAYLTGFFGAATFYGIHSILWALQQEMLSDLRRLFKKRSI